MRLLEVCAQAFQRRMARILKNGKDQSPQKLRTKRKYRGVWRRYVWHSEQNKKLPKKRLECIYGSDSHKKEKRASALFITKWRVVHLPRPPAQRDEPFHLTNYLSTNLPNQWMKRKHTSCHASHSFWLQSYSLQSNSPTYRSTKSAHLANFATDRKHLTTGKHKTTYFFRRKSDKGHIDIPFS